MGELAGVVPLAVVGFSQRIEITKPQLKSVYLPLLAALEHLARQRKRRLLVGLAGIPGGGKSSFAAALAHLADRLLPPAHLAVAGMDGWHWPNAMLDKRTTLDASGASIALRERQLFLPT